MCMYPLALRQNVSSEDMQDERESKIYGGEINYRYSSTTVTIMAQRNINTGNRDLSAFSKESKRSSIQIADLNHLNLNHLIMVRQVQVKS